MTYYFAKSLYVFMFFSRRQFFQLGWKSISVLLVSSSELYTSCTWNKRKELEPEPKTEEPSPQPYVPPPNQSLLLDTAEIFFNAGEEIEIRWQQTGLQKVNLYFSSDGGNIWSIIVMDVLAEEGKYLWLVPTLPSSLCLFRVTNAEEEQLKSESASYFRIKTFTQLDLSLYPLLQSVNGYEIKELFQKTIIIIRKTAADFLILSMHCTHNGCIINYDGSPGFNCSCHGSQFNAAGEVLQGPAQKSLPTYEYIYEQLENELIIIV